MQHVWVFIYILVGFFTRSIADSQFANEPLKPDGDNDQEKLYDCWFNIFQDTPDAVVVKMYHLLLDESSIRESSNDTEKIKVNYTTTALGSKLMTLNNVSFEDLSLNATLDELKASRLDPKLPFIFFVNGFNHDGVFEASWMYDLASVYVKHDLEKGHKPGANVIFIPWHIENISATNPWFTYFAYLRTMANYQHVLDHITTGLTSMINYADDSISRLSNDDSEKEDYYSKFSLYGHSLGAHLLSDAIISLNRVKPAPKFGQIIGLDPARICFQGDYGISAPKLMGFISRVMVIHSNAGVTGVASTGGHVEILLNGGSFQPDCEFLDLTCHHARSHQILRYTDDQCMMVAYKCERSEQFNAGACHLCEGPDQERLSENPNCILVNLSEQHTENYNHSGEKYMSRRLAINKTDVHYLLDGSSRDKVPFSFSSDSGAYRQERPKRKQQYHFVNTNPEFLKNRDSHCLQHYQLRLLTMADDKTWLDKCPLKSHLKGDAIRIELFEKLPAEYVLDSHLNESYNKLLDNLNLYGKSLTTIVPETLHTGLLNFAGMQKLFVAASVIGIDLDKWSQCMIKNRMDDNLEFVLDIAFMSNTKQSVRNAHSSILCGSWDPQTNITSQGGELRLDLCKQTELRNVSTQVDEILKDIRFRHKHDTWQVLLLDSLFSLFTEWDPFNN